MRPLALNLSILLSRYPRAISSKISAARGSSPFCAESVATFCSMLFVEFERADAAEADVVALRAEEQAVLASAGCKTMVELAAKLQSLKDASGAEALHDAVEAPRGTAAAAAANGPPALKPGLKPLRYEDCLDGNIEKQIRGSTPNSAPSHSTPSLPATRRARLLAGLGGPGPGPGWSILKLKRRRIHKRALWGVH